MSTPTKLPAGLPALPPVPDGYDRWEYKGLGYKGSRFEPYAHCNLIPDEWIMGGSSGGANGVSSLYYIVAVRDAKPAKKATKKKAKRVKVRVGRVIGSRTVGLCSEMSSSSRVLVIPFDAASREAIVEQMVDVMFARYPHSELDRDLITADTRRQLATLHPDFAKEGR
jgi:hypothetical protein